MTHLDARYGEVLHKLYFKGSKEENLLPNDKWVGIQYADWLEEQGEIELSTGVRWCAENGKLPRKWGSTYDWWYLSHGSTSDSNYLSEAMFLGLTEHGTYHNGQKHSFKQYKSPEDSIKAVGRYLLEKGQS